MFFFLFHSPSKLHNQGQNAKIVPVFCSTKYLAECLLSSSSRCVAHTLVLYKQLHATSTSSGRPPRGVRQSPKRVAILMLDISKTNQAGGLKCYQHFLQLPEHIRIKKKSALPFLSDFRYVFVSYQVPKAWLFKPWKIPRIR